MFGNCLLYYGGPGGVRRGLIWQNGTEKEPEWITPAVEYTSGSINGGNLWGTFFYGGILSIERVTYDRPPASAVWNYSPGSCDIFYAPKKRIFRVDWTEWDSVSNVPQNISGASSFWFSYDWQNGSGTYIATVPHRVLSLSPYNQTSGYPGLLPLLTIYRLTNGSGARVYSARFTWSQFPWSNEPYPFNSMTQKAYTSDLFNSASCGYSIENNNPDGTTAGVVFECSGISEKIGLLECISSQASDYTRTHDYRIASTVSIFGYVDTVLAPSAYRGSWKITVKNLILPDFCFYNLHNNT